VGQNCKRRFICPKSIAIAIGNVIYIGSFLGILWFDLGAFGKNILRIARQDYLCTEEVEIEEINFINLI